MAESLLSKNFSEGAPLDPKALNDLRTDIVNTKVMANALYSQTVAGQNQNYKFIFNCGSFPMQTNNGRSAAMPIDLGNGFEASQPIVVTVTLGYTNGAPDAKDSMTPYVVSNGGQNYQMYVVANVSKAITVFWNAVQRIPTSS